MDFLITNKQVTLVLNKIVLGVCLASLLAGCGEKKDDFPELAEILEPTETTIKQRTVEWYAQQQDIRNRVVDACLMHLDSIARTSEDQDLVTKVAVDPFGVMATMPDCNNARIGQMQVANDGKVVLKEYQMEGIEKALQTEEGIADVNKLAADVARELEANDVNANGNKEKAIAQLDEQSKAGGNLEQIISNTP